jgi:CDGSH-type Zn-finger protein/truncated hemoglobin YjbI
MAVSRTTSGRAATAALLAEARALADLLGDAETAARLRASVIRPLADEVEPAVPAPKRSGPPADRLWRLAKQATKLRATRIASNALIEATAALQDLAIKVADPDDVARRIDELERLQRRLPQSIRSASDGPYLVTNASGLRDWLGVELRRLPQMALCRCGASKMKPLCDGSHAEIGFSGAKDPKRVPDRRASYDGVQVTVLDNRGTCAHAGLCTDSLPTVFHAESEPFVTPSGGRMDEIEGAVRACPSGALSYAIAGREGREEIDQQRPPLIEVSRDGPYRITGSIPLENAQGEPEARNQGASLEHYSLCRCGQSKNKPFCSGMHWTVHFTDPPFPPEDRDPTLFEWAGGFPALLRMTKVFYGKYVPEDPLLAPLFANMSPDHPQRVASWLGEVFGGPTAYSSTYGGYERMISQHLGKQLREEQRARWVQLLARSAEDAHLPADPEFRAAFVAYLEWGSRIALENSQREAHPLPHMPVPRWWWVCNATPAARPSALAPTEEAAAVTLPKSDEPISFTEHIKPLFREHDRGSMRFAFDLWSYEDVSTHADAIYQRLEQGSMPCDRAWPAKRVDAFRRWIELGKPA